MAGQRVLLTRPGNQRKRPVGLSPRRGVFTYGTHRAPLPPSRSAATRGRDYVLVAPNSPANARKALCRNGFRRMRWPSRPRCPSRSASAAASRRPKSSARVCRDVGAQPGGIGDDIHGWLYDRIGSYACSVISPGTHYPPSAPLPPMAHRSTTRPRRALLGDPGARTDAPRARGRDETDPHSAERRVSAPHAREGEAYLSFPTDAGPTVPPRARGRGSSHLPISEDRGGRSTRARARRVGNKKICQYPSRGP